MPPGELCRTAREELGEAGAEQPLKRASSRLHILRAGRPARATMLAVQGAEVDQGHLVGIAGERHGTKGVFFDVKCPCQPRPASA